MLFVFELLLPRCCRFFTKLLLFKLEQLLFLLHAELICTADLPSDLQVFVPFTLIWFDAFDDLPVKDLLSFLVVIDRRFSLCHRSRGRFKRPKGVWLHTSFVNHVLIVSDGLLGHLHPPVSWVLVLNSFLPLLCLDYALVVMFDLVQKFLFVFQHWLLLCV